MPPATSDEEDEDENADFVPLRCGTVIELMPACCQEPRTPAPPSSMGPCMPACEKDFCPASHQCPTEKITHPANHFEGAAELKKQKVAELLARFDQAYRNAKYKEAYQLASLAHEIDPDNPVATTAMLITKSMIRKQQQTTREDLPTPAELITAIRELFSGCVEGFLQGCGAPRPSDATQRMDELLQQLEDIRQIEQEWLPDGFADRPSHLSYDRTTGSISEAGISADRKLALEKRLDLPAPANCKRAPVRRLAD